MRYHLWIKVAHNITVCSFPKTQKRTRESDRAFGEALLKKDLLRIGWLPLSCLCCIIFPTFPIVRAHAGQIVPSIGRAAVLRRVVCWAHLLRPSKPKQLLASVHLGIFWYSHTCHCCMTVPFAQNVKPKLLLIVSQGPALVEYPP